MTSRYNVLASVTNFDANRSETQSASDAKTLNKLCIFVELLYAKKTIASEPITNTVVYGNTQMEIY